MNQYDDVHAKLSQYFTTLVSFRLWYAAKNNRWPKEAVQWFLDKGHGYNPNCPTPPILSAKGGLVNPELPCPPGPKEEIWNQLFYVLEESWWKQSKSNGGCDCDTLPGDQEAVIVAGSDIHNKLSQYFSTLVTFRLWYAAINKRWPLEATTWYEVHGYTSNPNCPTPPILISSNKLVYPELPCPSLNIDKIGQNLLLVLQQLWYGSTSTPSEKNISEVEIGKQSKEGGVTIDK